MRLVFGLVLIVGLGLAGFAVYMAQTYIGRYQQELANERQLRAQMVETVDVIVANRPLRYGERLEKSDVRFVKWPENAIPEGAFTTVESLFPPNESEPRAVLRAMEKDEAVLAVKVTEPGQDAGLTSRLSPGKRAFTIEVDASSGVSGFLRPGDRVDVYWTGTSGVRGVDRGEFTRLIDTALPIIAVDQSADMDRVGARVARNVTVEVDPQQVASLAQAQATGRLALSLVGVEDDSVAEAIEVDQQSLLGITSPQPTEARPAPEPTCTIRTRRGAEVVTIQIPCN